MGNEASQEAQLSFFTENSKEICYKNYLELLMKFSRKSGNPYDCRASPPCQWVLCQQIQTTGDGKKYTKSLHCG